MTAYISSIKMSIPSQWPPEVSEIYEPVRELGRGGFASVILARRKDAGKDCVDKLVAMKVVGEKDPTRQEVGYAHREIDILKELNHPNIMRLVQYWEPPACAAVMALSYVKGSTLESLLGIGGRLSLNFARVVTAQLVRRKGCGTSEVYNVTVSKPCCLYYLCAIKRWTPLPTYTLALSFTETLNQITFWSRVPAATKTKSGTIQQTRRIPIGLH